MLSADPDIRRLMALRAIEGGLLRLKWLAAATRFELALLRHDRALKAGFNPNEPRVPAGSREGGQWTSGGGGQVRLASSDMPRLGPKSRLAIAIEVARMAIKLFRDRNLLHNLFGQKEGTVTYTELNDTAVYGVNSESPEFKDRDMIAAEGLRSNLILKHPDVMATQNIGQAPNNAVFHAETTVLLRAARANGGSLAGKSLEIHVDRPMCPSCNRILPLVGLELGDPAVTFIGPSGVPKTMRGGAWIR
jgi:hypothetical protein